MNEWSTYNSCKFDSRLNLGATNLFTYDPGMFLKDKIEPKHLIIGYKKGLGMTNNFKFSKNIVHNSSIRVIFL